MENMDQNEVMRIADQLRRAHEGGAWHGPALFEILEDVNAEMAASRPLSTGHTIGEIVLHIMAWEKAVLKTLNGAPLNLTDDEDWPSSRYSRKADWQEILKELRSSQQNLLTAVLRLKDSDLANKVTGREYSLYVLLHGVIQHTLFHAGQVSIMKRALQNS